jgi:hypothetical protein
MSDSKTSDSKTSDSKTGDFAPGEPTPGDPSKSDQAMAEPSMNGKAAGDSTPKFSPAIDSLRRYSVLFFRVCLALALVAILVSFAFWGTLGLLGAAIGSGLVLANDLLLVKAVKNARPGRLNYSIWVTIGQFYLAFAVTIAICALVVKFKIGAPLAFLAGLSIFFASLVVVSIWAGFEILFRSRPGESAPLLGSSYAGDPKSGHIPSGPANAEDAKANFAKSLDSEKPDSENPASKSLSSNSSGHGEI